MNFENSVHYQLNTSTAAFEWAALVPSNGGIVHVGPERQPFLPSIFHQLRCLDIIRKAYVKDSRGEGELGRLSHHCLNYLRQMIMCQSNLRLEPVVDPNGVHAVQPWGELSCRDWRSVYNAVAENDVEFARWKRSQEQGRLQPFYIGYCFILIDHKQGSLFDMTMRAQTGLIHSTTGYIGRTPPQIFYPVAQP